MDLTALSTFLAIVESGSLAAASARLNVTPSTVTSRLKGLEAELGQTLLHRQRSGAALTSYGFRFKRYAEAMSDLWQQAQRETSLPEGTQTVCNLGCHIDLWPDLGCRALDEIHRCHGATVLSAWPGNQLQLEQWLGTGMIDAALTYRITAYANQTINELNAERLILLSTGPGSPTGLEPGYVYVDAGGDFGRRYTAAYADANFAKVSFGSALWALEYILDHGGSAYLPDHLAAPYQASGELHVVPGSPVFTRARYLVTNDTAAANWVWLPQLIERLSQEAPGAPEGVGNGRDAEREQVGG